MNDELPSAVVDPTGTAFVADVVRRVVGALAPEPVERAGDDQNLVDNLGYYSLRLIELSFAMEELFALEPMTIEDAPPISTVRELQEYLLAKVAAGRAAVPDADAVEQYLLDS
jgi:acyl carrier protein